MESVTEGTVVLSDGRRVAYATWGPADAPPVLYCHGFPGNRRELLLSVPAVERCGVRARVVALNRPGYGESTYLARRTFVDWPADAAEAADRLGIGRFAVLGASGGAPYALSCRLGLGDRVTRVGIVAGAAPLEATGMKDTPSHTGWSAIDAVRRIQFGVASGAVRAGRYRRIMERVTSTLGEPDRRAMERAEVRQWFVGVLKEAYAQGGRASSYEAGLYQRAWGFDPAGVEGEVRLWYGGADRWIPVSAGRWLAERIPRADLTVWPHHGHFTWALADEVADVVRWLAAGSGRT